MPHLCTVKLIFPSIDFLFGFIYITVENKELPLMLEKDIRNMKSSQPLYIRLYEHLREYIASEQARSEGKLPKELDLCRIFGVSRNTVSQALFMLEEEQLICRIKHRGTFLLSVLNEFDPQSIRRTIGAVFPKGNLWIEAITAIREGCRTLGYDFRLFTYDLNIGEEEQKAIRLAENYCGGVILYFSGNSSNMEYIRQEAGHYPFVLLDLYVIGLKCNLVSSDHYLGAYSLAETLISKGCRKFCILGSAKKNSSVRLRIAGYTQALDEYGINYKILNDGKVPEWADAILDPEFIKIHAAASEKKIWLARFDEATETEQRLFHTLVAKQDHSLLGMNSVILMKDVLRSGMTPERSILIAPEIIEQKEIS